MTLENDSGSMPSDQAPSVEKVVLEPDEDLSYLRRRRRRSRSAEQLSFNHNRHRHHYPHPQYHSDQNIHYHHHHHDQDHHRPQEGNHHKNQEDHHKLQERNHHRIHHEHHHRQLERNQNHHITNQQDHHNHHESLKRHHSHNDTEVKEHRPLRRYDSAPESSQHRHHRRRRNQAHYEDSISETSNNHHHQRPRHRRYYSQNDSVSETSSHRSRRFHHHTDSASEASSQTHRFRRHHNCSDSICESQSTASHRRSTRSLVSRTSTISWELPGPLPELLREDTDMTVNLSLCGCGFLGMYHLGVASCLVKYGQSFLARLDRVAGASAGALAAAVLVTAPTVRQVELSAEFVTCVAKKIRRKPLGALTPGFHLTSHVSRLLDKILPPDAHELARGRLYVSLTHAKTKQNEIFTEFKSRDELIQVLTASCHIPIYSGKQPPLVRGEPYYDGGLTDNLLRFNDGRTITVSPFSGKQDIGPHDALDKGTKGSFFNLHNQDIQLNFNNIVRFSHAFFPPRRHVLNQYFELGHKDASRFLAKEGLYEIKKPGGKKPVVLESSV